MLDELSDVDIWDMVETGREEAPRCLNTGSGSESWSAVPGWKLTLGGGGARTSGSKLNTQSSSPPQLSRQATLITQPPGMLARASN